MRRAGMGLAYAIPKRIQRHHTDSYLRVTCIFTYSISIPVHIITMEKHAVTLQDRELTSAS